MIDEFEKPMNYLVKLLTVVKSPHLQSIYKSQLAKFHEISNKQFNILKDQTCTKCLMNYTDTNATYKIIPQKKIKFPKHKIPLNKYQHKMLKRKRSLSQKMEIQCGFCSSKFKRILGPHHAQNKKKKEHVKPGEPSKKFIKRNKKLYAGLNKKTLLAAQQELNCLLGKKRKHSELEPSPSSNALQFNLDETSKKPKTNLHSNTVAPQKKSFKSAPQKKGGAKELNEMRKEVALVADQRNNLSCLASKKEKKKLKHKLKNLVNNIKNVEVNSKKQTKSHLQQFLDTMQK